MDEHDDRRNAEGTAGQGGELVGPGTGGSPAPARGADAIDPAERAAALEDPAVRALVEELRADERVLDDDTAAAAEQAGTGTDR